MERNITKYMCFKILMNNHIFCIISSNSKKYYIGTQTFKIVYQISVWNFSHNWVTPLHVLGNKK